MGIIDEGCVSSKPTQEQIVADRLATLSRQFRDDARLQLALITGYCQSCSAGNATATQLDYCYRTLHRLAGAAGTFGCPDLGTHARTLEQRLKPAAEGHCAYQTQIDETFLATLADMKTLLDGRHGP